MSYTPDKAEWGKDGMKELRNDGKTTRRLYAAPSEKQKKIALPLLTQGGNNTNLIKYLDTQKSKQLTAYSPKQWQLLDSKTVYWQFWDQVKFWGSQI